MSEYGPWLVTASSCGSQQISEVFVDDAGSHQLLLTEIDRLMRTRRCLIVMEPIEDNKQRVWISPGDMKDVFGWLTD